MHQWRRLVAALFLLAYFLYFSWDSLGVRFANDDMMNIAKCWMLGPLQLLGAQLMPWRGYERPMAGLIFMPILSGFGLNPVPYHAAMLAVLLVNVYLFYRFARLLGCGELAAGLAALIACYHPGLSQLYFNTAFIYDALCCFFYLGAFNYYVAIRQRGRVLCGREVAAFLGLYLCALNSKEMALTLPVVLLAYEWIYHACPGWGVRELVAWIRGPGLVALLAALLNLVYVYGKAFGFDPLMKYPGYRPVFSLSRFTDFHKKSPGRPVP